MFEEFLKAYIQDLIECSSDAYEITKEQIEKVADRVERNEYVWSVIDECIYNEIDEYRKEEE